MSPERNSPIPTVSVVRDIPLHLFTRDMPPRANDIASAAATKRRARSSKCGNKEDIFARKIASVSMPQKHIKNLVIVHVIY
jgi:hypothetical protein